MTKNKRPLVTIMGLIFLLSAFFLVFSHYREKIMQKDETILILTEKCKKFEQIIGNLELKLPDQPDWARYEMLGLADPETNLKKDLMKRKDLIPWKGVMGGNMAIYNEDLIWFMAPNWCLAYFEDGHIGGYMLLKFKVQNGKISWNLIDAKLID
ncbi:hypothetical protein [Thermovirga lienii]|uniref:hypothetical protein n=1 Tax=Thermovirga lienii TaxID=336261 RepID=UPI00074726E3|nr:MAG: Uncharacterized protein XD70_1000 [Thermovirga lienii]